MMIIFDLVILWNDRKSWQSRGSVMMRQSSWKIRGKAARSFVAVDLFLNLVQVFVCLLGGPPGRLSCLLWKVSLCRAAVMICEDRSAGPSAFDLGPCYQ
jgi:hypothetical protein